MQPRAEEIYRVLSRFAGGSRPGEPSGSKRRAFSLVVQGSRPLVAEVRELRDACAMVDIGSSIFTLAYSDILGIDPVPSAEGGLRLTVRPGCFASHVAARLRRTARRSWTPTEPAASSSRPGRDGARPGRNGNRAPELFAADPFTDSLFEDGETAGSTQPLAPAFSPEDPFLLGNPNEKGGIAGSDPAESESAGQEIAGNSASRRRS